MRIQFCKPKGREGRQYGSSQEDTQTCALISSVWIYMENFSFTLLVRKLTSFRLSVPKSAEGCLVPGNFGGPELLGTDPALLAVGAESRVLPTRSQRRHFPSCPRHPRANYPPLSSPDQQSVGICLQREGPLGCECILPVSCFLRGL